MSMFRLRVLLLVASLLSLSGCFSLSRGAAPRQYYVLGGAAQPEAFATNVTTGAMVGIRAPRLDEYLASPFIVVRNGANRITFSDFERWAEDLGRSVQRSVARHMMVEAPGLRVEIAPWSPSVRPDYLIELHVLHFEGVASGEPQATQGEAHALINWEILSAADESILLRGVSEAREPGWVVGDFDDLVTLLDDALARTADDLVRGMQGLTNGEAASESPSR